MGSSIVSNIICLLYCGMWNGGYNWNCIWTCAGHISHIFYNPLTRKRNTPLYDIIILDDSLLLRYLNVNRLESVWQNGGNISNTNKRWQWRVGMNGLLYWPRINCIHKITYNRTLTVLPLIDHKHQSSPRHLYYCPL